MDGRCSALVLVMGMSLVGCGRIGFDAASSDGGTSDGATSLPAACAALPPATGTVVDVTPATRSQLPTILTALPPHTTLVFAPGQYDLAGIAPLEIGAEDVVLRSASGDPADVTLVGDFTSPLVRVRASRVTISGLTFLRGDGGIVIADTVPATDVLLYKIRVGATAQSSVHAPGEGAYTDRVTLACSTLELGDAGRATLASQGVPCDSIGLNVVGGRTWRIVDTTFDGFWCGSSEGIAAVLRGGSRDVVFERNRIVNSYVGLRLGLATEPPRRTYADEPACASGQPNMSAMQVRVVNNLVIEDGSVRPSFDSAIALWNTCDGDVNHNTISVANTDVFSAIEYRFAISTGVRILNNAVSDVALSGTGVAIRAREGATADTRGNVIEPDATLYARTGARPLAPAVGSPLRDAADCTGSPPGCAADYYGATRGTPADVGAIEVP